MTEQIPHPIQSVEIVSYCRSERSETGPKWIARYLGNKNWTILFQGSTEDEVVEKAEAFRAETIANLEAQRARNAKRRLAVKNK